MLLKQLLEGVQRTKLVLIQGICVIGLDKIIFKFNKYYKLTQSCNYFLVGYSIMHLQNH